MEEVHIEYHTATGKSSAQKLSEVPEHLAYSFQKVGGEAVSLVEQGVEGVGEAIQWSAKETGNIVGSFFSGLGVMNTLLILILALVTVVVGLKFLL